MKDFKRTLDILASLATIISLCIAIIALIPTFGQWLSPLYPQINLDDISTLTATSEARIPYEIISLTEIAFPTSTPAATLEILSVTPFFDQFSRGRPIDLTGNWIGTRITPDGLVYQESWTLSQYYYNNTVTGSLIGELTLGGPLEKYERLVKGSVTHNSTFTFTEYPSISLYIDDESQCHIVGMLIVQDKNGDLLAGYAGPNKDEAACFNSDWETVEISIRRVAP